MSELNKYVSHTLLPTIAALLLSKSLTFSCLICSQRPSPAAGRHASVPGAGRNIRRRRTFIDAEISLGRPRHRHAPCPTVSWALSDGARARTQNTRKYSSVLLAAGGEGVEEAATAARRRRRRRGRGRQGRWTVVDVLPRQAGARRALVSQLGSQRIVFQLLTGQVRSQVTQLGVRGERA